MFTKGIKLTLKLIYSENHSDHSKQSGSLKILKTGSNVQEVKVSIRSVSDLKSCFENTLSCQPIHHEFPSVMNIFLNEDSLI